MILKGKLHLGAVTAQVRAWKAERDGVGEVHGAQTWLRALCLHKAPITTSLVVQPSPLHHPLDPLLQPHLPPPMYQTHPPPQLRRPSSLLCSQPWILLTTWNPLTCSGLNTNTPWHSGLPDSGALFPSPSCCSWYALVHLQGPVPPG